MLDKSKEKVSALMDDELFAAEIKETLNEIKTDDELRGTWQNFHLISAILQNSMASEWLSDEISMSVSDQQTHVVIENHCQLKIENTKKAQ